MLHGIGRLLRVSDIETGPVCKTISEEDKCPSSQGLNETLLSSNTKYVPVNGNDFHMERQVPIPYPATEPTPTGSTALEKQVLEIRKTLQHMDMQLMENMSIKKETLLNAKEWRSIAIVLDRIFFILYVFAIGSSLGIMFPRPK